MESFKKYLLEHDNLLTSLLSCAYNFFGQNKIRVPKGNNICIKGNFLKHTKIIVNGTGNTIEFGKNNHLVNSVVIIRGNNNTIRLGNENSTINCEFWIEDNNGGIEFGNCNKILGRTHLAETEGRKIILGDGCLFSTNVIFRTGDSHSIIDVRTGERINHADSIIIGNRVWFGNNTTILKGARIADDTIVATGAIVTKDFTQKNIIIAGTPAKMVKEEVKWIAERI